MKSTIVRSKEAKTGYAINVLNEEGTIVSSILIDKTYKDQGEVLQLPDNPVGAKWYSIKKLEKQLEKQDEIELLPREKRVLGQRVTGDIKPKVSWLNWATDEEKAIIDKIQKDCMARMDAELNDPKYKLKIQIEKYKAQLAKLEAELAQ